MGLLVCLSFFVLFTSVNSAAAGKIKNSEELPNISADVLPSEVHASNGDDEDFNRFTLRNCECQCAGKAVRDKNSGQEYGNCNTNDDTGAAWCYIEIGTNCHDAKPSNEEGYLMSNEACTTPNIGNPLCKKMIRKYPSVSYHARGKKIANAAADVQPGAKAGELAEGVDKRQEEKVHGDCDCQCSPLTRKTKINGKQTKYGACLTIDHTEDFWCYVEAGNKCRDTIYLPNEKPGYRLKSYQACSTPSKEALQCVQEEDWQDPGKKVDKHGNEIVDPWDNRRQDSAKERAPPALNCNCQCHDYSFTGADGVVKGNCKSEDVVDGKLWCFVDSYSSCRDKMASSEGPEGHVISQHFKNLKHFIPLSISKEACTTPPSHACNSRPPYLSKWAADALPSVGEDMAAAEEPATHNNKKHVAVDITMHFKNHMSPDGHVSTDLGTDPYGPESAGQK